MISSTVFAIPPRLSKVDVMVIIPSVEIVLGVHLRAKRAERLAGVWIDPSAWPPIEMGLYPAATPTADPVDDPPGFLQMSGNDPF